MTKNVDIAYKETEIEAYLSLLGYEVNVIKGKCALLSQNVQPMSDMCSRGIMNLETLEWIIEPIVYEFDSKKISIGRQLLENGFMSLKYMEKLNTGELAQYIDIVDCYSGEFVMRHKRRCRIETSDRYIITAKKLLGTSQFRCSFIDLSTRKHLDLRVNTYDLTWTQGMALLPELRTKRWLGATWGYFKIPIYADDNESFNIPKDWGKSFIYGTDYGIESEIDIMKRTLEDPMLIKVRRSVEIDDTITRAGVYFWISKPEMCRSRERTNNYTYYNSQGKVIGRRFRNMSKSEEKTADALSDIIDSIENGTTTMNKDGIYEYITDSNKKIRELQEVLLNV